MLLPTALLAGITLVLASAPVAPIATFNTTALPDMQVTAASPAAHPTLVPGAAPAEPTTRRALTAAEERTMFLQNLEEGGASDAPWTLDATGVFARWRATTDKGHEKPVSFSPVQCYRQGCTITIRYAEQKAFDLHGRRLPETGVFRRWQGAKWRSGPVVTTAGIEATWILFAPPPAVDDRWLEGNTGDSDNREFD